MHTAVDCATDTPVVARLASRNRRYRCARCHAPVELRSGIVYADYFAHAIGKAQPDCDLYVKGGSLWWPSRTKSSPVEDHATAGRSELYFEMGPSGPAL